jgi:iron complex outermembrane receptor protein
MRHFYVIVSLSLFFVNLTFSQTAIIQGTVKDGPHNEPIESANVVQLPANGVQTDSKGYYELKVPAGEVTIVFSYIGLKPDTQIINVRKDEVRTLNVALGGGALELDQVVIGETRMGVKLQKVTQSVDIMKPRLLENNNITNMQNAVAKIPGVVVLDGQMSIRGGSGYAYGSGSRVMLVVDEMPLMTADRGEIKWAFVPVENVEQMEVIKGASSVQYGSSALNGVLNITTAYARDTPETKFTFFYEGMAKPPVDSFQWWKRDGNFFNNPNTTGMTFLHKQKIGDFDIVFGGMLQGSQSYLNEEYDYFTRFNTKIRYKPHKLRRLTLELATNLMYRKDGFQFYWQDAGHPYISASGVDLDERYFYAYIDPKIRYVDKKNNEHKIYGRINRQNNVDGQTDFWIYRAEYQFRHDFGKLARIIFGVNNEHWKVSDGTLGTHQADFGGGFLQGEINYKWFSFNAGVREEYVHLDSAITPTVPVFRAGVNFEIRKYNYIRASFGQAYRVPSIAERFVEYNLAGIRILPNYDIQPERGFTAELGYKRSLKIGNWLGYVDAVVFWTEFKNMIEFSFGTKYTPETGLFAYFQSQNVAKARVFGWELSAYGEGKWGPVDFTTLLGYTYFYGVDLNDTSITHNVGDFIGDAFKHYAMATPVDTNGNPSYSAWQTETKGLLKYRNPHTFKADFDFIFYNKYHFGTSIQYYSYMTSVDPIFEVFIKGVKDERIARLNKGDVAWDLRAGYEFNRNLGLNFIVKNVLNSAYAIRIAHPNPPRSYTLQMTVNFGPSGKNKSNRAAAFNNI